MGQAGEVGQLNGGAVGFPDGLERPADLLTLHPVLDLLKRQIDVGHVVTPPALPVSGGLGGAHPINRPVPGHGHQPGPGAASSRRERSGGAPHLEEYLLEDLLALGTVDDDLQDQRE